MAPPRNCELIARLGFASLAPRERATLKALLERVRPDLARGKRKEASTTPARFLSRVRDAAKRRPSRRDLVSRARRTSVVLH